MSATHRERALETIADYLGISLDKVTPVARLQCDLGCDNLDVSELLTELENTFEVAFSPEEDATVTTVGDLLNLVDIHAEAAS